MSLYSFPVVSVIHIVQANSPLRQPLPTVLSAMLCNIVAVGVKPLPTVLSAMLCNIVAVGVNQLQQEMNIFRSGSRLMRLVAAARSALEAAIAEPAPDSRLPQNLSHY